MSAVLVMIEIGSDWNNLQDNSGKTVQKLDFRGVTHLIYFCGQ